MKPHLQQCDKTDTEKKEKKNPSVLEESGPCGDLGNLFGYSAVKQENHPY